MHDCYVYTYTICVTSLRIYICSSVFICHITWWQKTISWLPKYNCPALSCKCACIYTCSQWPKLSIHWEICALKLSHVQCIYLILNQQQYNTSASSIHYDLPIGLRLKSLIERVITLIVCSMNPMIFTLWQLVHAVKH